MFKSRPCQLFYQFLRVDAFDIISIVMSVHATKRYHMRPGGATVARLTPVQMVSCSNHVRVNFRYQFLRVDAFDIILIVISVYARKRHHMRPGGANGSVSESSSEGCVFKSRPGQLFVINF